jgi:threonine dehydrogenase-like Zn-dependent dehydrogenase
VKALVWEGVNEVAVTEVPDPQLLNRQDAILKVNLSSVCGSDLHQLSGYIPFMRAGDVIGHEFMGEIVEVGTDVRRHQVGDRVVVCSVIACGRCWYCRSLAASWCTSSTTRPSRRPQFVLSTPEWRRSNGSSLGLSVQASEG